ncbi:thioredoxin-disulfide reductase [Paenibacillus sp. J2TS4]|nr:NAD(P)/FAD-dependent oxidoreductase [Paenibacillus sp. J2TS4]GIP34297.1 thioredoxin-disulfide reductase [Paenibacillus sp. J2TS4]
MTYQGTAKGALIIHMNYECIIVGGGIAGLQAAIQLGRYEHRVLVVDSGHGRSTLCRNYHNLLGWPEGVSGDVLRQLGREHAAKYEVEFAEDYIVDAYQDEPGFVLKGRSGQEYRSLTLLLATGILDRLPELPGLLPCLGLTVYVCPDCDGYEIRNRPTLVLGSGDVGARMALTLHSRTNQLVYINHGGEPVNPDNVARLRHKAIPIVEQSIQELLVEGDGNLRGVRLADDEIYEADRAFVAFGGNLVNSQLAEQLGIERMENKHIVTDPRTKMTNVKHVWVAGDIGVHSELAAIAMGEGVQAAIWIHKALLQTAEQS